MIKSKNIVIHNTRQAEYTVREQGEWLVVPVVMMTEGVRHGSDGAVLHQSRYYSQSPEAWNGTPVTAGHPTNSEGSYVSVNSVPESQWVVGHLQNARAEEGKLKADVYINQQRAIAVNPEVVNYLSEGRRLEVSIGAFTKDRPEVGVYGDEEYQAVTLAYYPDHLALLPGERGACSWQDGCGIRTNKKEETNEMSNLKEDINKGLGVLNGLQTNQTGFVELSQRIQSMLDRRDSEAQIHFLKEIYDDYFVYEVRDRDQGTQKFFRQDYSFNEQQNDVDFEGSRAEVRRNVEYVPIQRNKEETSNNCGCGGATMTRTKFNNNKNTEDSDMESNEKNTQPSGDVMEKVVSLVNNERTRFGKTDREWLLQLNESQLDKLEPTEADAPEVTKEQAIQTLQEDLGDIEKVKDLVPDDVKAKIDLGLKSYKDVREKLIKSIQTNTSEEDWPTDTLEEMTTDNLERLSKSVRKTDYSGLGPTNNTHKGGQGEEVLLPAGIELE